MRNVLLVLIAVLVAGATAMLARNWLADQRNALLVNARGAAAAETPTAMVLVANSDLRPGQFVQADQLRWQVWPQSGLSTNFVIQGRGSEKDYVGAVARTPVMAGEPITEARFVKPGDRGFLAAVLDPGMRAVTVPITAASGNAGLVFPGDRVDLVLTSRIEEGEQAIQFSDTVIEGVRVLAIDQSLSSQGEAIPGKTASLEVTPAMAEKVALALQMGTLSLSLRSLESPGDMRPLPFEPEFGPTPTLDRELYAVPSGPRPPASGSGGSMVAARRLPIMLLRGSEAIEVKF